MTALVAHAVVRLAVSVVAADGIGSELGLGSLAALGGPGGSQPELLIADGILEPTDDRDTGTTSRRTTLHGEGSPWLTAHFSPPAEVE